MTGRAMRMFGAAFFLGFLSVACTSSNPSSLNEGKPVVSDPLSRARVHTELAALYYQQGSMKTALDELGNAIKIDPQYAPAYNMLGLVYMQLGEQTLASTNFQKAVSLAPNDPDIRNNYGLFLCDTHQYQQGLSQLDIALANPLYMTPVRALDNAARCAQDMGDAALASRYRQQAARYGVSTSTSSQKLQ